MGLCSLCPLVKLFELQKRIMWNRMTHQQQQHFPKLSWSHPLLPLSPPPPGPSQAMAARLASPVARAPVFSICTLIPPLQRVQFSRTVLTHQISPVRWRPLPSAHFHNLNAAQCSLRDYGFAPATADELVELNRDFAFTYPNYPSSPGMSWPMC